MNRNLTIAGLVGAALTTVSGIIIEAVVKPASDVSDKMWSYPWTSHSLVPASLANAVLHLLVVLVFELLIGQVLFVLLALLDCGHGVGPFDCGLGSHGAYPCPRSAVVAMGVGVLARTANNRCATCGVRVGVTVRGPSDNLPMDDPGLTAEQKAWVEARRGADAAPVTEVSGDALCASWWGPRVPDALR